MNPLMIAAADQDRRRRGRAPVGAILIAGTPTLGFYGEIPAASFITGGDLASSIGLAQGTPIFNDQPWLKFAHNNKTLYVAKKPFRKSASWNAINSVGAALGSNPIVIDGKSYKVRLLTGTVNGEFDTLMYRVHANGGKVPTFAQYASSDLGMGSSGDAYYTLCQEIMSGVSSWRIGRNDIPSNHTNITVTDVNAYVGWRPVLELVE